MRRILPTVVLLAVAALIVLAIVQYSGCKNSVTGKPGSTSTTDSLSEAIQAELATQPGANEHRANVAPAGSTTPAEPERPSAHLKVLVIGKTKLQPIAGATVGVWPVLDEKQEADPELQRLLEPLRRPTQEQMRDRITGPSGEIAIDLPPGIDVDLGASVEDLSVGTAMLNVAHLQPGEHRDVVIELPDSKDAHVFGRVVAEGSSAPIAEARVALIASNPTYGGGESRWDPTELDSRTTGVDGVFEFDYPTWREPHLRVEASGYGLRLSEPLKECLDASHPLVIELSRNGTLRAHVLDSAGRACDSLWVDLVADGTLLMPDEQQNRSDVRAGFPDEKWRSKTGPDGWVTFGELPAQVWIQVYLHMGGRITRPEGNGVKLAPGETKEVEWRMGPGCTLTGLVLDGDGKPVSGTRLWLTRAWSGSAPYFRSSHEVAIEQTGITDTAGRFELVGVPSGDWFLGPAPDENWDIVPAGTESIAPFAERVVIGNERSKEVTLHVDRGLFISGHVVHPDGKPCNQAQIFVDDEDHQSILIGDSYPQGEFRVGPLRKQVVLLSTQGCVQFMGSEPVRARPGDSDVHLTLRPGGNIQGRVVDSMTGSGCAADLRFTLEGASANPWDGWSAGATDETGNFDSFPRAAGSYSIAAMTDDGRFALVKGIGVVVGSVHPDVLLQVSAGGRLRLSYRGAKSSLLARIKLDGADIKDLRIEAGKPNTTPAPAGRLVLEVRSELDGTARTQAVELKPGETKEITLTDED